MIGIVSFQIFVLPFLLLLVTQLFRNWFHLRSVPGPFIASTSNLWRAYNQYTGQLRGKLLKLHQKHGPIVRYGVNNVSFSGADAIQPIYSGAKGFTIVSDCPMLFRGRDHGLTNLATVRLLQGHCRHLKWQGSPKSSHYRGRSNACSTQKRRS
jgi:hypothetical protein